MPAIQPEQLERQIDALLALAGDPPGFMRACMNLLDYYADRTKRPRGSTSRVEIAHVLRVPRPVMKTICVRIRQVEGGTPENWLEIANDLWGRGIREARQLAACALAKSPEIAIPQVVEQWAVTCEDEQALAYITSGGLKTWRAADLERFYATVETWLGDHRVRVRHLAILALEGRTEDGDFQELHSMLKLLAGISSELRGSSQRSLTLLIRQLAEVSPPEVAKFLIDEIRSNVSGSRRLAENVLPLFPERLQREIRQALG